MKSDRVRLSGGRYGGSWVAVPRGVRPTSARVREALLDSWQFRLPGAHLLELFAGSGAVGLEALGRGAASLVAVEADRRVLAGLGRTCRELGVESTRLVRARLPEDLGSALRGERFDLIFADPPYAFEAMDRLIAACADLLDDDGELVVEHSRRRATPEAGDGLARVDQRRYGESVLSVYRPRK